MTEQSSQIVNRKGDATASFLNEIFEKMEVKLMQMFGKKKVKELRLIFT
jgi:hypothetical protein